QSPAEMQPAILQTPYFAPLNLTGGPSLGNFKTISGAAHGAQVARIFRIAFNLFAKLTHINIYRTRSHELGFTPHRIENLVAGKNPACMARKIIEHTKFRSRSGHRLVAHGQPHGAGGTTNRAGLADSGRQRALARPDSAL